MSEINDSKDIVTFDSDETAFAVYSADDNSLTFYAGSSVPSTGSTYNGKTTTNVYTGFETDTWSSYLSVPWYSLRTSIKTVSINSSFKSVKPISLAFWFYAMTNATFEGLENIDISNATTLRSTFYSCSSLVNVDGLSGWDTSNVTTLYYTFYSCSSLVNVDGLSGWDTSNVTDMSHMFGMCSLLTSLDVSGFDTKNVTDMGYVFYHCENVSYLDVSTWETSEVTVMSQMFGYCYKLIYLDLSNFNTSNVTAMNGMFREAGLEKLNLSRFDTSKVTEINAMFRDAASIKTIYIDSDWDLGSVTNDTNMFLNCPNLVGGNGTKYDSSKVDSSMAHIDTADNPGYFTGIGTFAVYSATDDSLTFYNDIIPAINSTYNGKDVTDVFREFNDTIYSSESQVPWYSIRANVKSVSFDETFKSVKLIATDYWFCGFENCVEFKNLDNINTSEVESTSYMFSNCSQATYLNLSGFDTSNVTDMSGMFQYFNGFYIETSSFNTSKVTNFQQMFAYCQNIICMDVSNFNMSSAQNIEGMFMQMNNLIELSLGGWDISNVAVASNLFCDSQSLKTIRAFNDWNLDTTEDDNMFYNCQSLVGGNGTAYDLDKVTGEMAKVDRKETEGYFTKKYNCFCDPISYIAISKDSKKSLAAIQDRTTKAYFGISLDPNSYPSVDSTETSLLGVAKLGVAVLRSYDFWTDKIPKIQDDEYLWMRLLITNKDGMKEWSEPWLLTI